MITLNCELYSSKNSKQIFINRKTGKPFVAKSAASIKSSIEIEKLLIFRKKEFLEELKDKNIPYKMSFKIYRRTNQRFDYVNIIQGLLDCLVNKGIIKDDSADYLIPIFEEYEIDKLNPRVEIKIYG